MDDSGRRAERESLASGPRTVNADAAVPVPRGAAGAPWPHRQGANGADDIQCARGRRGHAPHSRPPRPMIVQRRIAPAEFRRMPWRNGAGSSDQILSWPADDDERFVWRAALADDRASRSVLGLARDRPHVRAGRRRRRRPRLRRSAAGRASRRGEVARFRGEDAPACRLVGGSARAFNLMVRRGRARGDIVVATARATRAADHGVLRLLRGGGRLPRRRRRGRARSTWTKATRWRSSRPTGATTQVRVTPVASRRAKRSVASIERRRMTHRYHAPLALLPDGWARDVSIVVDDAGSIASVDAGRGRERRRALGGPVVPSMPNLHSHAFQRAVAGRTGHAGASGEDSFWTWRESMYRVPRAARSRRVRGDRRAGLRRDGEGRLRLRGGIPLRASRRRRRRVRESGRDGPARARRGASRRHRHHAAAGPLRARRLRVRAGVARPAALLQFGRRLRGDPRRARARRCARPAPCSASRRTACARRPPTRSTACSRSCRRDAPVHIHVAEQTREVDDCLAWSGRRPVAWLLERHGVGPRWCLVHATHLSDDETRDLAASGAVAGLAPTTEADLGDGTFNGRRLHAAREVAGASAATRTRSSIPSPSCGSSSTRSGSRTAAATSCTSARTTASGARCGRRRPPAARRRAGGAAARSRPARTPTWSCSTRRRSRARRPRRVDADGRGDLRACAPAGPPRDGRRPLVRARRPASGGGGDPRRLPARARRGARPAVVIAPARVDTLVTGVHLATMDGAGWGVVRDGAIALAAGRIAWIGPERDLPAGIAADERLRFDGAWALPGLRRLPHAPRLRRQPRARVRAAPRAARPTRRSRAKAGASSRRCARRARRARTSSPPRAGRGSRPLAAEGATTVEIKSGYGLELDAELKQLAVARRIGRECGVDVRTTLLAAHAVPPEFAGRADDWIDAVCARDRPGRGGGRARRRRGRVLRHDRLHARADAPRLRVGARARPAGEAARRAAVRPGRRRARRGIRRAVGRSPRAPVARAASTRWPPRARSRCCCPARTTLCARRSCRRSTRCGRRASRWRSRPTATRARRRRPRRS